ncbi:Outer membrane receptor for ferrienterochelin and colicins [Lutibacter agarilyticus]|uniref:Outer membrane receptor for ferrienterochelin and colicins n=1 Tax=Lutibacter agarilyticus TaxID=1109740 RepID=A0A238X283_9FLAO|nr:TonB-dependent receptor [Lutibacter agarilyticus]SNR53066.1 Outer membrane receptor for ferrienterochelin and colicins [Lutibacter agarilyticus]
MKKLCCFLLLIVTVSTINAQDLGVIRGKVIDAQTREALPFVNILILGTNTGVISDESGNFLINNSPLGYMKLQASFIGYQTVVSEDYLVTLEKSPYIIFQMNVDNEQLEEVVIQSKLFRKPVENPLSYQSIGIAEIEKNPGGDRDILKVIQSFPGVASNPGFRNDIIIRGGSPAENKFYLDGVEVPVINHFQTQGSTGGPVGIINADLIRKADFYSSAFSANRGNALSSIIEFTMKEGNPEKLDIRATLGTSDAGITADGHIGEKTTFIASVRQSYLSGLFRLLKLPFLPTYNDFQLNVKHKFDDKNELSLIGLGAIDKFKLNEDVNDGITDEDDLKRNNYILSNIPVQNQWNYTVGLSYKHYGEKSTQQIVLSRNEWDNVADKYEDNTGNSEDLLLKYSSRETENKLRYENFSTLKNNYKLNFGVGLEQVKYYNATYQKFANSSGVEIIDFSSNLSLFKYGIFGQISKAYFNSKLNVSFGVRFDGVDYDDEMSNLFKQFSPRLSLAYALTEKWAVNASAGIYNQLPSYTVMGYRDNDGVLVNKENGLEYITAEHLVAGLEFKPNTSSKVTLEGFYKGYNNYPFSVENQISLANLGAGFGVVGNEEVTSTSEGRAYGFEVLLQKKSYSGLYGILSYTFVRSEFKDLNNEYIPSSWDNRNLLTATGGKKFNKNWELGAKFRLVGGRPYTPYDYEASADIANYNVNNSGILDYSELNTLRFDLFHQLDIRVDKTWYWKHFSLNLYLDIQNILGSENQEQGFLTPLTDADGNALIDPSDPSKYLLEEVENTSGTVLPKIGVIMDF